MLLNRCKKCGLIMTGTRHATNINKILWCHPQLMACAKVKPITRPKETRHEYTD